MRQQRLHRLGALVLDQVVGIHPRGQTHDSQRMRRAQHGQRPRYGAHCGALSGSVAIETQDRALDLPPQQFDLVLGQRGPQRGDRLADARVGQRDRIHIALDDDHPPALPRGGGGAVQIVERAALVEQRRVGTVEIFGGAGVGLAV